LLTGPIAVICALDWELAHLRSSLAVGELDSRPLVLAVCGIGMGKAAQVTQMVCTRHRPRAVLNYGCAGAHRPELLQGDIVVGTRAVAYEELDDVFQADPDLLEAARRAAERYVDRHEPWPESLGWPAGVEYRPPRVVFGTVCSADRWNRSTASIAALVAEHDSWCEDMEAAAIGRVCANHAVPFLTIKDISNNELLRTTGPAVLDELGADQVARRAASFTLAVVREISANLAS
jgi:nucleoside phosphorylase